MSKVLQIGVKALIVNSSKEILLIKRTNYAGDRLKDLWDIPGGRIEIGEEPEDALFREITEEIGKVKITIDSPIQVKSIVNNSEKHIVRITYLCMYKNGTVHLSGEHSEFAWFGLNKLPKNIDWLLLEAIKKFKKHLGG